VELNRVIEYAEIVAARAAQVLPLASARFGDEYHYQSLPLCVIDSVFSIGVRYEGVRNVVARYCARYGLRRIRAGEDELPQVHEQESVSSFCGKCEERGPESMAADVFENRQRTSSRNGILKAEAAYRFAAALRRHGVEYLQDVPEAAGSRALEGDIRSIPGQGSGISLQYFFMLAGSDELIKPDRMVRAFLESALGRPVDASEAQELMTAAATLLQANYPHITPRLLDHEVWKFQRG